MLQATNFAVSIWWTATFSISIVPLPSSLSNWTVAGITIASSKFAIECVRNFWLARGSLCCAFGIIRFDRNSKVSCKRSGLRCRSSARPNPHLSPLPLPKGEASFDSVLPNVGSRWNRQIAGQQFNSAPKSREQNRKTHTYLSGLQETKGTSQWNASGIDSAVASRIHQETGARVGR
jgi:hypothetical protein